MAYPSDYFNEWHPTGCHSSFIQAAKPIGTLTHKTGNYERRKRETTDTGNTAAGGT